LGGGGTSGLSASGSETPFAGFGGGGGLTCDLVLLFKITGIESGPFSTAGGEGAFFLSCDRANKPIPNRQNRIRVSLSFISLIFE
jgi:hypothetical protein